MWRLPQSILTSLKEVEEFKKSGLLSDDNEEILRRLIGDLFYRFVDHLLLNVDEIVQINPELEMRQILQLLAENIVRYLDAKSASIRIYDSKTKEMLAYGSFMHYESRQRPTIDFADSVLGRVFRRKKSYPVPNILKEKLYKDKEIVHRLGVHSMLAVPFRIAPFSPKDPETIGVIQIYFEEPDRDFEKVEIRLAEMMANRVTFAVARKKVLDLYRMNEKKEMIVETIFNRLGRREGIKMKEVFSKVIPGLIDMMYIQSCALFSVIDNNEAVLLEAEYPETESFYGIGEKLSIEEEPYLKILTQQRKLVKESAYEKIDRSYLFIKDPRKSRLMTEELKKIVMEHNINSILYIPMLVDEKVNYILSFYALDRRKTFANEEIEIFIFLGMELMKAHRLEMLDDILHDFRNPAIATAGFARRLKALFEKGDYEGRENEITRNLDIVLKETSRLQELALSVYDVGKESVVDMTEELIQRFEINEEAIKEQLHQNIRLVKKDMEAELFVLCHPLRLERIFDNLLNNATNAIPEKGGVLSIRTYRKGQWGCAEIANTGVIPNEDRERLITGAGKGRGLHITNRFIRMMKGTVEVKVSKTRTTFLLRLPICEPSEII